MDSTQYNVIPPSFLHLVLHKGKHLWTTWRQGSCSLPYSQLLMHSEGLINMCWIKKILFEFYNIFLKHHSLTSDWCGMICCWRTHWTPNAHQFISWGLSYNCLVMDFIFKWHCIVNEIIYLQANKFT